MSPFRLNPWILPPFKLSLSSPLSRRPHDPASNTHATANMSDLTQLQHLLPRTSFFLWQTHRIRKRGGLPNCSTANSRSQTTSGGLHHMIVHNPLQVTILQVFSNASQQFYPSPKYDQRTLNSALCCRGYASHFTLTSIQSLGHVH